MLCCAMVCYASSAQSMLCSTAHLHMNYTHCVVSILPWSMQNILCNAQSMLCNTESTVCSLYKDCMYYQWTQV